MFFFILPTKAFFAKTDKNYLSFATEQSIFVKTDNNYCNFTDQRNCVKSDNYYFHLTDQSVFVKTVKNYCSFTTDQSIFVETDHDYCNFTNQRIIVKNDDDFTDHLYFTDGLSKSAPLQGTPLPTCIANSHHSCDDDPLNNSLSHQRYDGGGLVKNLYFW